VEGGSKLSSQESPSNVEYGHRRIKNWLDKNYLKKLTKDGFYSALKMWIRFKYGEDSVTDFSGYPFSDRQNKEKVKRDVEKRRNEIEEGVERYLSELDEGDFLTDLRNFIHWLRNNDYAGLTIKGRISSVMIFFGRQDDRCKISKEDFAQLKRTLLPKSTRASTQDDILTKEQLKILLQHMSIHLKAIVLFLLSTGARMGAVCQLKMRDINLYSDPPEVNIREEYTKAEVGGRVMWFSYEARDAIIEWHKTRTSVSKRGIYGSYDEKSVFNYSSRNFRGRWNRVLAKADGGQIPPVFAKRDPSTKNKIHVYHGHTLRKFFRTNMGFEGSYDGKAGVPDVIVHGWMGHKAYLEEAYARGNKRMAEIYAENMNVVTVYEFGLDEKTRAEVKEAIERADKLARQVIVDRVYIDMVGEQLGAFAGLSEKVIEALSGKEKWNLIINKAAQLKAKAARSSEEIETALKQMLVA